VAAFVSQTVLLDPTGPQLPAHPSIAAFLAPGSRAHLLVLKDRPRESAGGTSSGHGQSGGEEATRAAAVLVARNSRRGRRLLGDWYSQRLARGFARETSACSTSHGLQPGVLESIETH